MSLVWQIYSLTKSLTNYIVGLIMMLDHMLKDHQGNDNSSKWEHECELQNCMV